MSHTPIHALQYLAAGSKVPSIIGTITKVYPERSAGTNEYGDWSFQKAKFRGTDGNECSLKFCNMAPIGQDWAGVPICFTESSEPKAKSIVVDEHNGNKSLKVNQTAQITWNPPDFAQAAPAGPPAQQSAPQGPPPQQGPPARAAGPPPQQHSAGPPQGPPAQQQSAPPQQRQNSAPPARTGPMPIHGATVGMAVKIAAEILSDDDNKSPDYFHSRSFSRDLHEIASDILRVSAMLEQGKLAASPSRREAAEAEQPKTRPAPQAPPERTIEPDHSHEPPLNAAERAAAERNAANGYPPNYNPEREPAFPSGGVNPIDDDEIPF